MASNKKDPSLVEFDKWLSQKASKDRDKKLREEYSRVLAERNKLKQEIDVVQEKGFVLVRGDEDLKKENKDLREQLRILQVQADQYVHDFQEERRDRESAHGQREELRRKCEKLMKQNKELHKAKSVPSTASSDLQQLKIENDHLKRQLEHAQLENVQLTELRAHQKEHDAYVHRLEKEHAAMKLVLTNGVVIAQDPRHIQSATGVPVIPVVGGGRQPFTPVSDPPQVSHKQQPSGFNTPKTTATYPRVNQLYSADDQEPPLRARDPLAHSYSVGDVPISQLSHYHPGPQWDSPQHPPKEGQMKGYPNATRRQRSFSERPFQSPTVSLSPVISRGGQMYQNGQVNCAIPEAEPSHPCPVQNDLSSLKGEGNSPIFPFQLDNDSPFSEHGPTTPYDLHMSPKAQHYPTCKSSVVGDTQEKRPETCYYANMPGVARQPVFSYDRAERQPLPPAPGHSQVPSRPPKPHEHENAPTKKKVEAPNEQHIDPPPPLPPKPKPRSKTPDQTVPNPSQGYSPSPMQPRYNELQDGIGDEIKAMNERIFYEMTESRLKHTNEHAPIDPNLVCPVCKRTFRLGETQKCRDHVCQCCFQREERQNNWDERAAGDTERFVPLLSQLPPNSQSLNTVLPSSGCSVPKPVARKRSFKKQ